MRPCPSFEDIAAYVDDEHEGDAAAIGHHLMLCPDCSRSAAEIILMNLATRAHETRACVPSSLIAWFEARFGQQSGDLSRRQLFGGLAVAASLAATAFVVSGGLRRDQAMDTTLFRDFATLVAADRPLDFADRDPERLLSWFATRVPFPLPRLSAIGAIGLRGGRLCWLLERRVAALHLGSRTRGACLYLAEAQDLALDDGRALPTAGHDPIFSRDAQIAGAFWQDQGLGFGLVGDRPLAEIARLATRLRGDA